MNEGPEKRKRRKDARPGEILEAAFEEFSQHGYAATRLQDVGKRAGVARATIYRYFADKEALFVATMQSRLPAFTDPVSDLVDVFPGTTKELLRFILTAMYAERVRGDIRMFLRILITEAPTFPHLAKLHHQAVASRALGLIARVFARGVARGEVRADHDRLLPMVTMAPAVMGAVWQLIFHEVEPIDDGQFLDAHLDLVLKGILISSHD